MLTRKSRIVITAVVIVASAGALWLARWDLRLWWCKTELHSASEDKERIELIGKILNCYESKGELGSITLGNVASRLGLLEGEMKLAGVDEASRYIDAVTRERTMVIGREIGQRRIKLSFGLPSGQLIEWNVSDEPLDSVIRRTVESMTQPTPKRT